MIIFIHLSLFNLQRQKKVFIGVSSLRIKRIKAGLRLKLNAAIAPKGINNHRKITSMIAANLVSPPPLNIPAIIGLVNAINKIWKA